MPQYSPLQQKAAWQFANTSDTMEHMGVALAWLNECFALRDGKITPEQFTEITGHAPHGVRKVVGYGNSVSGEKITTRKGKYRGPVERAGFSSRGAW